MAAYSDAGRRHLDDARQRGVRWPGRLQGYNAYPDGTVENHQRIHPDYASNVQLLWTAADFDRLARQRVPEAMFHHAGLVYSAFSTVDLPGRRRRARPAAPSTPRAARSTCRGTARSTTPRATTGARPGARTSSASTRTPRSTPTTSAPPAGRRAAPWPGTRRGQRALVARSGTSDGRTYSVDPAVAAQQDTYPGREEYAAQNLATAWLALYIGQIGVPGLDRGTLQVPVATTRAPKAPPTSRLAP